MSYRQVIYRSQTPSARAEPSGGGHTHPHVAVASEVLEELDLAQGALGQDLLAEDIGDLLDGDAFAGLVIHGGTGAREEDNVSQDPQQIVLSRTGAQEHIFTRQCRRRPGPVPW